MRYDRISTYFKLNKKSFILATISGVIYNVLLVFVPIVQGKLIDLYKLNDDKKYIIYFALAFLGFVVFIQFNRFLKRYYVRDFANRMVLEMRKVSFDNLLKDDIKAFSKSSKGDIMNKTLGDIKDSAEGVRKILTECYDSAILMLGYYISLLIMDYMTTLIVTSFIVLSIITASVLKRVIYKATKAYKKSLSNTKDVTLAMLKNEIYYRGAGVNSTYFDKYSTILDDLAKKEVKANTLKSSFEPCYYAISLIGLVFIVYSGGVKVIDNIWLIGTFSSFIATYMLISTKTAKLGKLFNSVAVLKVSWKRCAPLLRKNDVDENIKYTDDKLVVNNLTFGYDDAFVLKNISFSLNKGESLGICGVIHSGKSTLLGAISGLYDYDGSIKLCGNELKDVKNAKERNFISYLPSEVEIFNSSLGFNVSFNEDVLVSDALNLVYLPFDSDTMLSHSVVNLSGGEEKRLGVARAIYHKFKLILLDNPFNALDVSMSVSITDNILNSCKDSIVVIVNNQKEILSKLDHVLFLYDGGYIFSDYEHLLGNPSFKALMEVK